MCCLTIEYQPPDTFPVTREPCLQVRQDPERASDQTHAAKAGLPLAAAMTGAGDNDTSVIRGPAMKKAGR